MKEKSALPNRLLKIFSMTLALNLCAWAGDYSIEERYQQAITLRNAELYEDAAPIFLELAEKGHQKAAHNYAAIQQKQKKYDLAAKYYIKAGLKPSINNYHGMLQSGETKIISLVAGSFRTTNFSSGWIADVLYDHKNTDLTHTESFNGFATTMDLEESAIKKASHIVADATQFDFSKHTINAVHLERFVTLAPVVRGKLVNDSNPCSINYMGKAIENVSAAMPSGAPLSIEWLPNTSFIFEKGKAEIFNKANPFSAFVNGNLAFQSIIYLSQGDIHFPTFDEDFKDSILKMAPIIQQRITFYHNLGIDVSVESLTKRFYLEALVLQKMFYEKNEIIIDYHPNFCSTKQLGEAFDKVCFGEFPFDETCDSTRVNIFIAGQNKTISSYYFTIPTFMQYSSLNFLFADIMTELNSLYVIQYLERLSFN